MISYPRLMENALRSEASANKARILLGARQSGKSTLLHRLSFWRTVHGAEVDYVLETPDETIPIEVKATDAPSQADASHLKLFLETYPKKARRGFLVCRCRTPRRLADNIEAIPWQNL